VAKSLLNGVNEVLKRVHIIQGDSGELTTLTDSARQIYIDLAVQVWNEQIDEIYAKTSIALPNSLVEATITLVTSDRDYALAADLVQLRYPLLDRTNGQYITEYPGGYETMAADQNFPNNYTGLPTSAAIRPTDGELYMNNIPTANENGNIYTYLYDKDTVLSIAADTVPFKDAVFRAMVPAVAESWKKARRQRFSQTNYNNAMARAATLLSQNQLRNKYIPTKINFSSTDPFHDG
jgi:hypothetical protein